MLQTNIGETEPLRIHDILVTKTTGNRTFIDGILVEETGTEDKETHKDWRSNNWNVKNCIGISLIVMECISEIGSISCLQLITNLPPTFELNTLRFAIGFVFAILYLVFTWQVPYVERNLIPWTVLGIMATFFFNLSFYNEYVKKLPIGAVFGTKIASFMLLCAAATKIFFKEKLGWLKIGLIFATLVGIGLVISSSFLPAQSKQQMEIENYQKSEGVIYAKNGTADVLKHEKISERHPNISHPYVMSNAMSNKIPKVWEADFQMDYSPVQKISVQAIVISITLIFSSQVCGAAENLAISGTGLKYVNGIFLAFWYCLFGTLLSFVTSLAYEDIFIPDNNMDRLLSVIHCTSASAVTFLYIFAVKLLNPTVLAIVFSIHIPLALTTQMFLLKSVTPPVELWVLILGLAIITISVFIMSTSAIFSK